MPELILELIEILGEVLEAGSLEEGLDAVANKFMGKKGKMLSNALKGLTGEQDMALKDQIGEKLHAHIKKNYTDKAKDKTKKFKSDHVDTPQSSWIEYLEYDPKFHIGRLKTKKSPKVYKLPFFPSSIIPSIQRGASPGKTLWRRYWRVFGKGKVSNKAKNYVRVKAAKKAVKLINVAVPKLKVVKKTPKRTFQKNLIKPVTMKTSNIPKTGAKGIKITIKKPKLRKY